MQNRLIAERYARALLHLAVEQSRLELVHEELLGLRELAGQAPAFRALLEPRKITVEGRKELYRKVFEGRVDPLVLRFMLLLCDKGRQGYLGRIIEEFDRLYCRHMGITSVRVDSATPLADDQMQELTRRLEGKLKSKIRAEVKIEPSLIGGFQIHVGDVVYDYSISHQLERLRQQLVYA